MATPPSLQDLPPELRKEIYTFLLVEAIPIRIILIRRKGPEGYVVRHEVAREGHHRDTKHPRQVYDASQRRWIVAPPDITSILLANRLAHHEARQIFYGRNDFVFGDTNLLHEFLRSIGQNRTYLRSIEILPGGFINRTVASVMNELSSARELRRLEISIVDLCRNPRVAEACKALLRTLSASHKERDLRFDVGGVLRVDLGTCCDSVNFKPWHHFTARSGRGVRECRCLCLRSSEKHERLRRELMVEVASIA